MQNLLDKVAVCQFFGGTKPLNSATLYRGIRRGRYPAPLKVGPGSSRWLRAECEAALAQMAEGRAARWHPRCLSRIRSPRCFLKSRRRSSTGSLLTSKPMGLHQPIVRYQGKILDGNNRYRACGLAGIAPKFADFEGTDAQAQAYVISANIHRRHLSADQRRDLLAKLIKADPSKSNRQIAQSAKVSHHTVGDVREQMETTGQIAQLEATTGADGKTRKRKGGKPKGKSGSSKPKREIVSYKEVVDAKTASNAYSVLEEHLLDALQDLNDQSSFAHADEYARRTIEKLEEKLGQMQPEMADAAE